MTKSDINTTFSTSKLYILKYFLESCKLAPDRKDGDKEEGDLLSFIKYSLIVINKVWKKKANDAKRFIHLIFLL